MALTSRFHLTDLRVRRADRTQFYQAAQDKHAVRVGCTR
jgi:hypothetical protein